MKLLSILAAAIALVLSSCFSTSIEVEAYPAEGADFSKYKTYAWVPLDREAAKDFTDKDRAIRQAFIREADSIMTTRGYRPAETGTPDLYLYARGLRMGGYRSVGGRPTYDSRFVPSDSGASWLADTSPGSGMRSGYLREESRVGVRFLISEPTTDNEVWRGKGFVRVDESRSELMQRDDARHLARRLLKGLPRAGS